MKFDKFIIDLANKYQMKPEEIKSVECAYDFVCRFAFIESIEQLDMCVLENKDGKEYVYKDIPMGVKRIVSDTLKKYGAYSLSNFYSPQMKPLKFEIFLKNMIEKKVQPRAMFEHGVLTYKNLMYSNSKNLCAEIVQYRG